MAGRPKGSLNKDKPFRDALRMELASAGEDHKALRAVANALIAKAAMGDVPAIKEIADRLDGKAAQPIENGEGGAFELVHRIERVIVNASNSNS